MGVLRTGRDPRIQKSGPFKNLTIISNSIAREYRSLLSCLLIHLGYVVVAV